jgi:spoIIIJ-associated protein
MTPEDANTIVEFINQVVKESHLQLTATAESVENGFTVQVRGADVSVLLAHNAEVLDALEYLGNRLLSKNREEETHIVFDSGNYRARREKELQMMAEKAAEKVRLTKTPFAFDPMSSNERRIIHLALSAFNGVKTESRGNGENRKLIVFPA